ncbi:hypothetical protein CEDIAZO_02595 [Celerinatantimonas diazotrophica]|nr:hypothetical protein CEDIAZO_02595 [Celerinatantimonas diazotrophica]
MRHSRLLLSRPFIPLHYLMGVLLMNAYAEDPPNNHTYELLIFKLSQTTYKIS